MMVETRKLLVISAILAVIALANTWTIAGWLNESGVIGLASWLRTEYFTGTALTVVIVLLVLIPPRDSPWPRTRVTPRCRVCDACLEGRGRYCPACGSRV